MELAKGDPGREGYFGYLPPELRQETRKFRRGNVPACSPLLIMGAPWFGIGVTIRGKALTQRGAYEEFSFHVLQGDVPYLLAEMRNMEQGGPGPIIFYRHEWSKQTHIARLPPGVGMWEGGFGEHDVLLYCHELIDAIEGAIDYVRRNPY